MLAELEPTTALAEPAANAAVAVPAAIPECVAARLDSAEWKEIEAFETESRKLPQVEFPLRHIFTPGLYTRQIFMPAGTLATSRIHLFEHPFVISAGVVSVWGDETGWQTFRAPHTGVTLPGTRRVLYIHEDTTWTTFHVTTETDPDKIAIAITYMGGAHAELGMASCRKPLLP